jgi:hypothetical protein
MARPIGFYKDKEGRTRPITPRRQPKIINPREVKKERTITGMRYDEGLIDTFRKMYPNKIEESRGLKAGDLVRADHSNAWRDDAKGKLLGYITEIRVGRAGPLLISADKAYSIGPKKAIACIQAFDGTLHFAETEKLVKVR